MDEGNHAVNVSAATTNQSNEVTSFLQIIPVSIQSGSNRLNIYAFLNRGSTGSFIDQSVQEKLRAQGTDVKLNIADRQVLKTVTFPSELVYYDTKVGTQIAVVYQS